MSDWQQLPSDLPDLFPRLRALNGSEVWLRFQIGVGDSRWVEIPAALLSLRGNLRVEPEVDRFGIEIPGWGSTDFAWFRREKGRGIPEYWQGAIEHHAAGAPALVLYFTAPLAGLEISIQD